MVSENSTDKKLKKETLKWLKKAEDKLTKVKKKDNTDYIVKNAQCYINDANYFLEQKDFIRGFEAVIWAWAFLEISQNCGLVLFSQ